MISAALMPVLRALLEAAAPSMAGVEPVLNTARLVASLLSENAHRGFVDEVPWLTVLKGLNNCYGEKLQTMMSRIKFLVASF